MTVDGWASVWAKSAPFPPAEVAEWLPLHQHLDDTAGIAGLLVDHWVPTPVLRRIADDVGGIEQVKRLTTWLAGIHDVGKASPAFVMQVPSLCERMRDRGLSVDSRLVGGPLRSRINHALVGHTATREWLLDNGFTTAAASALASVVGSHHGVTPEWRRLQEVDEHGAYAGRGEWVVARQAILDRAATIHGSPSDITSLGTPALALLTAIVIVADWIASNVDLFPLWPIGSFDLPDDQRSASRLATAWVNLALPARWHAPEPGDVATTFVARFGRSADSIRDIQVGAVNAAHGMKGTGLLIIEAPMGQGKTEAALLAAEVLAHDSGANGCFIALPTQATTDAMFGRVRAWLDHIPGGATLALAHGKAHLNDTYAGMVSRGGFATDCAVTAHEWLRGRKRAGLAGFVVGTIDQVLFAGLKSRHVMLRHLALAGKVVVIDEVHAYDVYMSQYLRRVLHWLGEYRVPVILLSATLPAARRAELLAAYDRSAELPDPRSGYPVLTGTGIAPRTFTLPRTATVVAIDRLDDDLDTLTAYLREHLRDGGCAVVVRNTVTRVQETAQRLSAEFDVTINHARFLACDRAAKDRDLLRRFGPPETATGRPHRHVVVASQVVEQSLDIDFDLMVSDLAPIDLVLQRMGRLHRHHRPQRTMQPRCAIVGVDWSSAPPTPVPGSRKVYDDHQLFRAAALLQTTTVSLPHDIDRLVQLAYGEGAIGPTAWQSAMVDAQRRAEARARKRKDAAGTYLLDEAATGDLIEWLGAHAGEATDDSPRGMAQVRDGSESLEVLVVQRDSDGGLRTPDWIARGGEQIPLFGEVPWPLARRISTCTLRLPFALCHEGVIDTVIHELEKTTVDSFRQSGSLRGQLVLVLDDKRSAAVCGYQLTYDPLRGLLHERV